jgi:hypothetical protein
MAFTGKATYSAGTTLPELAEDVSDLIGIISPYETPLLDALGDPMNTMNGLKTSFCPIRMLSTIVPIPTQLLTLILWSIMAAGSA